MATPNLVTRYDLYDLARFSVDFVSTDGVTLADPTHVTFYTKSPLGSVASYLNSAGAGGSITRLGVGQFIKELTLDSVGSWFYRWSGTGGVQANEEWSAIVDQSFIL